MLQPDGRGVSVEQCEPVEDVTFEEHHAPLPGQPPTTDTTPPPPPVLTGLLINLGLDVQLDWTQVFDCN